MQQLSSGPRHNNTHLATLISIQRSFHCCRDKKKKKKKRLCKPACWRATTPVSPICLHNGGGERGPAKMAALFSFRPDNSSHMY